MRSAHGVRPGRPDDLPAIAEFTHETFTWGDYVADAFLRWLEDPDSLVLVATVAEDRPIGLGRAVMLSANEAWLHGARVHPDHRRTGVGSTLNDALLAWAATRGAIVARLLIEEWNEGAQRQVEALGYRKVTGWTSATLSVGGEVDPLTNGGKRVPGDERLGPGSRAEIDPAWIAWLSSDSAAAGRQLFPVGWHFRKMTRHDVEAAARAGALWHSPSGWVIATPDDDQLLVPWVVTSDLDIDRLLRALVDRAERLRVERIRIMVPRTSWMEDALMRAGWADQPMSVWAKGIQAQGTAPR